MQDSMSTNATEQSQQRLPEWSEAEVQRLGQLGAQALNQGSLQSTQRPPQTQDPLAGLTI